MKLIIAVVSYDDANEVISSLIDENFYVTKLSSKGGFLAKTNTTFMCGVEEDMLDKAISIIKEHASTRKTFVVPNGIPNEFGYIAAAPVEVSTGGASLFIVDVEKNLKF